MNYNESKTDFSWVNPYYFCSLLEDFLDDTDFSRIDINNPKCCVRYKTFRKAYLRYSMEIFPGNKIRFNYDHYGKIFEDRGIVVWDLPGGDSKYHIEKWIFGVALIDDDNDKSDNT